MEGFFEPPENPFNGPLGLESFPGGPFELSNDTSPWSRARPRPSSGSSTVSPKAPSELSRCQKTLVRRTDILASALPKGYSETMSHSLKPVLLIIIDALATRVANVAINDGRLPTMARLAKHGQYRQHCWSMFPSITPAATCTLHTGVYPQRHGVAGAYWYDPNADRVAYYGDDIWPILQHGHGRFFHEFQITLNYDHLRVPTVFEIAQEANRRTACVNSMWFRGKTAHDVKIPLLFKLIPGVRPAKTILGPDILCLADFVSTDPDGGNKPLTASGGATRRYGFHDETTGEYLKELARRDPLPDLTIAYFPNNDYESHDKGPLNAIEALQFVDDTLAELFEIRGGFDAFLKETAVLITGDHSQSDTLDDDEERSISLDEVLSDFSLVPAGKEWENGEQVMACPNMRAAQIYTRGTANLRERVMRALLADPRIDQVLWAEPVNGKAEAFHVQTRDRGDLRFQPGRKLRQWGRDPFGGEWSWEGDLAAVDGHLDGEKLTFGDYPNAFERIAGGFFDESGHLFVTARVGSEFVLAGTTTHAGGSHGSLHALDSTSPLITAGLPDGITIPDPVRTVDLVPLMLASLNLPFPFAPGAPRPPV